MTARMLVAAHKSAPIPTDPLYLPIHVGHALNPVDLGYQTDDQGDNISHLNATYCELTALYWAWKNLPAGPIGLSHYRRYFVGTAAGPNGSQVLGFAEAESLLAAHDIIIGKPRNYVVETIDSHYRNGHHGEDLDLLREVMSAMHPADLPAFDRVFSGRKLSLYNMFLARREVFDAYATWVFPVLSEVSTQVQSDDRTAYQQRTIGYLGERLLNVWVAARSENLSIGTRKIVNVEGEPKISKAIGLIKRKISGGSDR
jgi:hypothetical protein